MTIALVTGATGFVGAALLAALQRHGWTTRSLSRRPGSDRTIAFDIFASDRVGSAKARLARILDEARPDVVFHLASVAAGTPEQMERVNVDFAEALLHAAAEKAAPPRIVLAGTAAEYGFIPEGLPAQECQACAPNTHYGATKLRQTGLGLLAAEAGVPVYLPRLFNLVGAGMRPHLSLGRFARDIARLGPDGGVLTTGPLEARRDFTAVEDAVEVLIGLCGLPEAVGQVVNVCSGTTLRIADMLKALIDEAGVPVSVEMDSSISGVSSVPVMVGCTRRLAALGFHLAPPNLKVEMARLLAGYRAQPLMPDGTR